MNQSIIPGEEPDEDGRGRSAELGAVGLVLLLESPRVDGRVEVHHEAEQVADLDSGGTVPMP